MKIISCKICGKGVMRTSSRQFRCKICAYFENKKNKRESNRRLYKNGKEYKCRFCKNIFKRAPIYPHKYCSFKCRGKAQSILRKGKKSPNYRNGFYLNGKQPPYNKDKIFWQRAKKLKETIIAKYGHIKCQKCRISVSPLWDTHHIIFRSEAPKHENLHNVKNLIILCRMCHQFFHKKKSERAKLVISRKLWELFPELNLETRYTS